jgi:hypothetical protein
MAKDGDDVARRPGRPKADNSELLDDILVAWLRIGGPKGLNLDRAIAEVVTDTRASQAHVTAKHLRERLRAALNDMFSEDMLLRAMALAEQRGVPVPGWARGELAEIQRHNREFEAAIAAVPAPAASMAVLARSLAAITTLPPGLMREIDQAHQVQRLMAFYRAFDNLLPDMLDRPISELARLFALCGEFIAETRQAAGKRI